MHERRDHPRRAFRFLVQHSDSPLKGYEVDYATDLSPSGLFIATDRALQPEATLHVQFAPAKDTRLVSATCRVARVTPDGVGAKFVGLDAEARSLIEAALA